MARSKQKTLTGDDEKDLPPTGKRINRLPLAEQIKRDQAAIEAKKARLVEAFRKREQDALDILIALKDDAFGLGLDALGQRVQRMLVAACEPAEPPSVPVG